MLKESKILKFFIFLGILACSSSKDKIMFEPYVEQIIDLFLIDNVELDPSEKSIVLSIEDVGENEFILFIMSEMTANIPFVFSNYKETVCSGHYQQFMIFIVGSSQRVLKGECNEYKLSINKASSENGPISYDGALWELKIQDSKIFDFSYKFCRPNNNLIEQLKSIQVNPH
ncbi:MAG: hypothetical protein PHD61_08910 [Bacteroidales bacterium]|nr:hypothetical protein [Bacteroidales bacterium]